VEKSVSNRSREGFAPQPDAGSPGRRALRMLQRLAAGLGRRPARPRRSAEATTLPAPSRGQALREAHYTLRERLQSLPALRQVLPHLSCIERKLAKRGSRAFARLPVPVLQRGLEQLAMLQREDETPIEALNLRVLRLRLIEAIAMRSAQAVQAGSSSRRTVPASGDRHPGYGVSSLPAIEVSEVSSSVFSDAAVEWADDASATNQATHRH